MHYYLDELLSYEVGANVVADNVRSSLDRGLVQEREDGRLTLVDAKNKYIDSNDYYSVLAPIRRFSCIFLRNVVHNIAYQGSCIPYGCRDCYKVKVCIRSLRELMSLLEVASKFNITFKAGVELNNQKICGIYGGYFYVVGLQEAKEIFGLLRYAVNEHPRLGSSVPMLIKRGCTDYEYKFGPSNMWSFAPELEAVESNLALLFYEGKNRNEFIKHKGNKLALIANWVNTAYRVGDSTYLDLTGGKPLFPKVVTYHD